MPMPSSRLQLPRPILLATAVVFAIAWFALSAGTASAENDGAVLNGKLYFSAGQPATGYET